MSPVFVPFDPLRGPGHGGPGNRGFAALTPRLSMVRPLRGPTGLGYRVQRVRLLPSPIPFCYMGAPRVHQWGHRHPGTGMSPVFVTFDPLRGAGTWGPGNRGFATLTPRLSMVGPLRGPTGLGYRVQRVRLLPFPMTLYYMGAPRVHQWGTQAPRNRHVASPCDIRPPPGGRDMGGQETGGSLRSHPG